MQLGVFNRICKHHIEASYFNDQIMLLKCLNNIIYRLHENIDANQGRMLAHNFYTVSHFKYDKNKEMNLYRRYTGPLNEN